MPLKKGTTNIGAIYKGTTEIAKIYKGTSLIYENYKWLDYLYNYLYHDLIPTTISSKSVQDQAKVSKIYGNSVVVNQLVNLDQTVAAGTVGKLSGNNTNITSDLDKRTVKMVSTGASSNYFGAGVGYLSGLQGHKVMCLAKVVDVSLASSSYATISFGWCLENLTVNHPATPSDPNIYHIGTFRSNIGSNYLNIESLSPSPTAGDYIEVSDMQMIDLTLMFGTGNEPTTITDNRIQALLNRGYIPYNTGEIKSVDIGEFESEPYNLFDDEFVLGNLSGTANIFNCASKNFIEVVGGKTYVFENGSETTNNSNGFYYREYDENFNQIGSQVAIYSALRYENTATSFTVSQQTKYIKFFIYIDGADFTNNFPTQNLSIHLQGTRTGYAPHTSPDTLSFKYQGNGVGTAHDTMEITKTGYIFTKNNFKITLTGNETITNLTQFGTDFMGIDNLFNSNVQPPDSSLPMFNKRPFNLGNINNLPDGYCYTYGRNFYYNIGTNDQQANIDFITGLEIQYPLATPQVITIPRKHLAVIDLGSLSWNADTQGGKTVFKVYLSGGLGSQTSDGIANIYCSKYVSSSLNGLVSNDKQIRAYYVSSSNPCQLGVYDSAYTNATNFKNAMSGVYLFYETESEVADILDTIDIEAGGSITSNWFSWVRNQLTDLTPSHYGTANGSIDKTDNIYTITVNASQSGIFSVMYYSPVASTNGHKYLVKYGCKTSVNGNFALSTGLGSSSTLLAANGNWQVFADIVTSSSGGNQNIYIRFSSASLGDVFYFKEIEVIDLTLAFGSGNEPTTITDPRIQYILSLGYIPTDTTGTLTAVDTEVLPNVDIKAKCK